MKIDKVFNNNVVATITEDGKEAIVTGPGVGFQKKAGDLVDPNKIKKQFFPQNVRKNKLYKLLERTPIEYLEISEAILNKARMELNTEISDSILIALTDHIAFSIERQKEGIKLPSLILTETKVMYPEVFKVGEWALHIIKELMDIQLEEDEAGYITLHIINGMGQTGNENAFQVIEYVKDVTKCIENTFQIQIDRNSLSYTRLTSHLKFFVQRLLQNKEIAAEDFADMYHLLEAKDSRLHVCMDNIKWLTKHEFEYDLDTNEMVYLMIHILKVIREPGL